MRKCRSTKYSSILQITFLKGGEIMGYTRLELKNDAKQALTGKWGISVGVTLIYTLIAAIASQVPIIGPIALFLCSPALAMGFTLFFLKISRKEDAGIETLFQWFPKLFKAFGLNFMIQLFVFLWSLLFIIPGIIASIRYSMAFFIMLDNPEIGIMDAIRESNKITYGHKMDIFILYLSFIGWALLAILTLGIGYLWLIPYIQTTLANLYDRLKIASAVAGDGVQNPVAVE